jgi:NAD(P)-dependent dehydrogenase (short-subunit alcohol dehydrogenase family)
MTTDSSRPTNVPAQTQEWPGRTDAMQPVPDHGETSWTGRGRLEGKRALISGGDSGIGRATAIAFAKEGADVAIAYLPEEEQDAAEVKSAVEAAGRRCVLLPTDQRSEEANVTLVEEAVAALGGLDTVVSNAAFQMGTKGGIEAFSSEQLERVYATNVFATFWLVKAAVKHLKPGSSIAITTSIQAYEPSEPLLDYASTKAALNNLMVNLASDLGSKGVRVNAVAPGPIWTPLIPSTFDEEKVEGFGADTPLGRPGQPVEVAAAFVFLASDEASYVSGTVLGVTGGRAVF